MKEKPKNKKQGSVRHRLAFAHWVNRILTRRNQCIFFVLTLIAVAAAVFDATRDFFPKQVSITIYVVAGTCFLLTCTLWVKAVLFMVSSVLLPFTRSNRITNTLIRDNRLRTVVTTLPGMGLNLVYAIFNGVVGVVSHSAWYGSLSVYYLLLCIMRFTAVSYARQLYAKKEQGGDMKKRELEVYKSCGVMLSFMSIALGGAVIMLVLGKGGKSYPGLMIYAVAAYTFYKLTMSIINMVKAWKKKSILLVALRDIGYSDSLVSVLSLQTALFAAFGQDSGNLVPTMNALTGAGVCLMVLVLGIYMVYDAKKLQREFAEAGKEAEG